MTDSVIKVCVIGAGFMGAMHARIWQQMYGVDVVGVADPDLSRSEALKEWIPKLNCYEDFNQMLDQENPISSASAPRMISTGTGPAAESAHIFRKTNCRNDGRRRSHHPRCPRCQREAGYWLPAAFRPALLPCSGNSGDR